LSLLSIDDALDRVLAGAEPLSVEEVPLTAAHGRVLARDLAALRTQPPAHVSAMDGYAVRAADVARAHARLKLVGEVAAGHPVPRPLGPGEAARIFTGGVLPPGADTVVIQEITSCEAGHVIVSMAIAAGKNVRLEGLDFRVGDVLLRKGRHLTARDLALAAAMNYPVLPVHRQPIVSFLATGDELVPPGTEPGPGQIVYSNGFALLALMRSEGAKAFDLGIVPDRLEDTIAAIRSARKAQADVLVSTGGASVGEHDLVQQAFTAEGMVLSFRKAAIRPGKPIMHGHLGAIHVLGLPGNPVAAYICSILFLVPLLRRLQGRSDLFLPKEQAVLGADLSGNDERTDYLRATFAIKNGNLVATPFPVQDSSMLAPLAQADCLVFREPYAPAAAAGSRCEIIKLGL
jgi:molybdopterin molybdotransferase